MYNVQFIMYIAHSYMCCRVRLQQNKIKFRFEGSCAQVNVRILLLEVTERS